jgi:hypothetical protein
MTAPSKINENLPCYSVTIPPPSPPQNRFASHNRFAILDSGATGTFVTNADAHHLSSTSHGDDGPTILSASGTTMPTNLQGQLPLSKKLSPTAQSAFVLDDLKTGTLLSLAQLCDDDCIAVFTRYDVKLLKNNEVIIIGKRMSNGLWSLPINSPHTHQANGILRTDRPKQELATYLHAALGSPAPSTLLRAIRRGHLISIPGLTTNLISKHLQKSIATTLGHQDQEAKHLRSTKLPTPAIPPSTAVRLSSDDPDLAPLLDSPSHQICAMLCSKQELFKSY